jgi:hypothetical protein
MKHDITQVGELFDGTPVYRFRYKNGPQAMQLGLMAQDIETDTPDAVVEHNGIKYVDYDKATQHLV